MVSLIPVLELEPACYATQQHPSPNVSWENDPEGWDRYWRDSLADSGIIGLEPWMPGSWLVRLDHLLEPSTLRVILRSRLADVEEWSRDTLGPMSGGYVLVSDGHDILPGCCSDLGNLDEWREAAEHRDAVWKQVWIGHPWTHVSALDDVLRFAEPSEKDAPPSDAVAVQVSRADLRAALARAEEEVSRFADRLTPLVAEIDQPLPVEEVVEILVYGHR